MTSKICFKCNLEKPIDHFYKQKRIVDGYLGKCKECTKTDVKNNYNNNFLKKRQYEQKRFQDPVRKAKAAEYQDKHRENNPEKYKARNAVNNAIRDKKLFRSPCRVCGNLKSQAHHHDYSKPLDVDWLCFKCHRTLHGQHNSER